MSGNPAINLVNALETNGGTLYLTDTNTAYNQTYGRYGGNLPKYPRISPSTPLTLPANIFTNAGGKYFLFEGAGKGIGQLTLTISKYGTNVLAQTSAWLDLHDVKDFYERVVITNNTSGAVSNWTSSIQTVQYASSSVLGDDTNIIIYAHGGDNTVSSWLMRSDTILKRLYWTGFYGRFASVRWPSPPLYTIGTFGPS